MCSCFTDCSGRLFPPGLTYVPSLEKLVFDGCYLLSLPGVMLAVAIWGYNSNRTLLSGIVIVAVNAVLYGVPMILLTTLVRYWRTRNPSR